MLLFVAPFLEWSDKLAKYNSNIYYNRSQNHGGAKYNTVAYVVLLRLSEFVEVEDNKYEQFAKIIFKERAWLKDVLEGRADYKFEGSITFEDSDPVFMVLFKMLEEFNIADISSELFTLMFVQDKIDVLEEAEQFAKIYASDKILMEEITSLEALVSTTDEMGFHELSELFAKILAYDSVNVTDRTPKTAISDFYITKDEQDLFDVIMPFGLIVDWNSTHIPFMPEAIDSSVNLAGADGEIVQDTVYGSRIFDIFAVTYDGLTLVEKEEVKKDIANILHSAKRNTKKLTFANNETSFDVKYTGLADVTTEAPSWMRFEIPLKSQSAYGHKLFDQTLIGSGLMVNGGSIPVGAVVTITGEVTNPTFEMGAETFTWKGTVKKGYSLVIDMDNQSCYMIDPNGVKSLATKNLTGEFVKIPVGSMVLQANSVTESHITAVWQEQVLY